MITFAIPTTKSNNNKYSWILNSLFSRRSFTEYISNQRIKPISTLHWLDKSNVNSHHLNIELLIMDIVVGEWR